MKSKISFLVTLALLVGFKAQSQTPAAGGNEEIQFNTNGFLGASSYLKWSGGSLNFLDIGNTSAYLYFNSEAGDNSFIFSENWGENQNRLVFQTADDGDHDYALFRNVHWSQGSLDVFEIHRTWTLANSNFYVMNGNVGIGTIAPTELLELVNAEPSLRIRSTDPSKSTSLKLDWGTTNTAGLHISYHPNSAMGFIDNRYESVPGQVYGDIQFRRMLSGGLTATMTLKAENGNVGIGVINPTAKLQVNGNIISEEIKVQIVEGPDYVFSPDYELRSLEETKSYIESHRHLPEVQSAKEMEENGVALGEMNMILLKKVEELTLYLIEQNRQNQVQQAEIEAMKSRIIELESR